MDCIPEKENLLLAYRDTFTSIKQTYPEWSDTDVRLQTAADLRPQFRLNRDAGHRENLGLSEYEVPEAAFTLTEDGSILYPKYGLRLLELHERQLRLTPHTYSPEEHVISLLVEEHFKQGATSVVTSYGDRDLVVMHFDPITKLGTTKIINATKQQSTVQDIAKKRYAHLESLRLTDKIFLFTDKKLSIQRATEVIEPIMKQRMRIKLKPEEGQQFVLIYQKQENKHIQPPLYKRLFVYADDSFRQEGQILPEAHAITAPKKLEPEHKDIWNNSVRPWITNDRPKVQEDVMLTPDNSSKDQPRIADRQLFVQQTKQIVREPDVHDNNHEMPFATRKILFQADQQPVAEQTIMHPVKKIEEQCEVLTALRLVLPLVTYTVVSDVTTIPTYEQAIVLSMIPKHHTLAADDARDVVPHQIQEQMIPERQYSYEFHTSVIPSEVKDRAWESFVRLPRRYAPRNDNCEIRDSLDVTQEKTKYDVVYEVDQLMIQDVHTLTAALEKQVIRGEFASVVTKLVWMMPQDNGEELVPVEEVEIAQNPSRTIQNLLHFLRKVVQKYVGDDTIHERIVQRIASDKWDNEIEEIAECLIILKTQRMYNHLFAVVN